MALGRRAGMFIFTAYVRGRSVGYARLYTFGRRKIATLQAILTSVRGKGYGSYLLRHVVRWLDRWEIGCRLNVCAFADRTGLPEHVLVEWYQRHGWIKGKAGVMKRPATRS